MVKLPPMRRTLGALAAATAGVLLAVPAAHAATGPVTSAPPSVYGPSWDDPRIADAPVVVPQTPHCSVTVMKHGFADWDVHSAPYTAPDCGGRKGYAKAVLRLDGAVKGRQYDRLGWLDINGVRILTTSTPEPNAEGITWHVEKDVTDELPILTQDGTAAMYLGNTVNETFTGVLDVTVTIDFYVAEGAVKAAETAHTILPLKDTSRVDGDLVGTVTAPTSAERVTATVYATGSGGGCEEFWDLSAPAETGYWCADGLPYREVDVLIDGRLAGIALPVPYVYTGGWSNPYLWYSIPSPGAFNILPLQYDLTPFVGELNDGRAHEVRIQVAGGPVSGDGWTLSAALHVWQDPLGRRLPARLVSTSVEPAHIEAQTSGHDDAAGSVTVTAHRRFEAVGWVDAATGRRTTTVVRALANDSEHVWTDGEAHDSLDATWSDREVVTTQDKRHKPSVTTTTGTWSKKGFMDVSPHEGIDGALDITTDLTIGVQRSKDVTVWGKPVSHVDTDSRFSGSATWLYGVPRDQRVATSQSRQTFSQHGDGYVSYWHELKAVNGRFTVDAERARLA